MFAADTANSTRFRVSYTFTDQIAGDESAIRKALRDLSFSLAFTPEDVSSWRVTRTTDGQFLVAAQRTLVDVIEADSERAALRTALYSIDLPDELDLSGFTIKRLDKPASSSAEPVALAAAA